MPGAPALATKHRVPGQPPDWVPRMLEAPDATTPAVLLVGGPGAGKTCGLLALARAAPRMILWYGLGPEDADVATFFHGLKACVQSKVPPFGAELDALLASGGDPRLLWRHFFASLASFNPGATALVLDDLHHVFDAEPGVFGALMETLPTLPGEIRLFMAARRRPPASLARARAAGHLVSVDAPRLAFSAEEAERLFRHHAPSGLVPDAWRRAAAPLEGWPLGIALVARGADADIGAFLAEELAASLSADDRELLRQVALLPEIDAEACRRVFGTTAASDRLRALERRLVLQRAGGEDAEPSWRLASPLRDALRVEARQVFEATRLTAWQLCAADFYRERGRDDLAVDHLIAAEAWEPALALCERLMPHLRFSGRQAQLRGWLEAFPVAWADRHPRLLLWRAHHMAAQGRRDEADDLYARAHAEAERTEDAATAFGAIVRRASIALMRGDQAAAGRWFWQAMARASDGREEDVADLHLARALAADQRGDAALMRACNEEALAVPAGDNPEIAATHGLAAINLFTHALHRGDLADARDALARADALAESWSFAPMRLISTFLDAHLCLVRGDVEAAATRLRGLPESWPELLSWEYRALALTIRGHLHQARGEWREADEALRRSQAIFERAGFDAGKKVPLERMMWGALARQQYDRVARLREVAGPLGEVSPYDLALRLPAARALHLAGDPAGALAELGRIEPALRGLESKLQLTRVRLYEAAARRELGNEGWAEALAEARDLMARHGYDFLLREDAALWAGLAPAHVREPSPGELVVRAFGGLEVWLDGVAVVQWPRRKAKLVLAALALYPQGLLPIELAELLQEPGPHGLSHALTALRRALEPELGRGADSGYVRLEGERYVLRPDAPAWVDLRAFEDAFTEAERLRGRDPAAAATAYARGLDLYRGALLDEDRFTGHFEAEREAYRRRALEALTWLADRQRGLGDAAGELRTLERAIAVAPADGDAYLALMRRHRADGHLERVRVLYWDYRKALKRYRGVAPDETFEAVYRKMVN